MQSKVTLFKNIKDITAPFYPTVSETLEKIRTGGKSIDLVKSIREEKDPNKKKELKMQLPSICFSGTFTIREDGAMIEHSGIICLDFDKYKSKAARKEARKGFEENPYVYSVFDSPSGDGLKVLVKVPPVKEDHRAYFNGLKKFLDCPEFDNSSINESRVCYISYDPKIYINEESLVWEEKVVEELAKPKTDSKGKVEINDEFETIERLTKWWNKELGFVEGRRNTNLFSLASGLCNYGISEERALDHIKYLTTFDIKNPPHKELESLVRSAYKTSQFNVKKFTDNEKMSTYESQLRSGVDKSIVEMDMESEGLAPEVAKTILSELEEKSVIMVDKFWSISDKGIVTLKHHLFRDFLVQNGFYKFYPEGSSNFIFVQRQSNRVHNVMDQTIKDFVLSFIERNAKNYRVWDFFAENTKYFKENFLSFLPDIEIEFLRDDAETSYIYYRNVVVKVTPTKIDTINYEDLDSWVWHDQIIDRDFVEGDTGSDFKQFIDNVSSGDINRKKSIESTIGFMLHTYKDPKYCPATIINDEIISDSPEGGTGKGIFMNALSKIRKVVTIDGKNFSFDKSFAYQRVQQDTQILVFDDIKPNFNFEQLFSVITEGITIEKKNKDEIKIPFHSSPKIGITTNYGVRGHGNSHERRKWEIEFKQHYRDGFTPVDEFGRRLFDDWNDEDWVKFDNYMIDCLMKYLKNGFHKTQFENQYVRKLIAETSFDFYDWIDQPDNKYNKVGIQFDGTEIYMAFTNENTDYGKHGKMYISMIRFYKWVRSYGRYKYGQEPSETRVASGKAFTFHMKNPQSKMF